MKMQASTVPYYSQWETADFTKAVYAEGSSALLRDPLWQNSGAETVQEYARWAVHICGMACLKMVLAARGEIHSTMGLAKECLRYGGYVTDEASSTIKGLIYAPFVSYVTERFNLKAELLTAVETQSLGTLLARRRFFIASVSSEIRRLGSPLAKGGHLILVTVASGDHVMFHNPGGDEPKTQKDVVLPVSSFDQYFANRGIAIDL